jgi:hypothetical protein
MFKARLCHAISLIAFISFLLASGCGVVKNPTGPTEIIQADDTASIQAPGKANEGHRRESSWSVSEIVDLRQHRREYASLGVSDVFKFTALTSSMTHPDPDVDRFKITIKAKLDFNTFGKDAIVFNFSPDGLKFSPPATLIIRAEVLGLLFDKQKCSVYYYDEGSGSWRKKETTSTQWNKRDRTNELSINIEHFSLWAISKD